MLRKGQPEIIVHLMKNNQAGFKNTENGMVRCISNCIFIYTLKRIIIGMFARVFLVKGCFDATKAYRIYILHNSGAMSELNSVHFDLQQASLRVQSNDAKSGMTFSGYGPWRCVYARSGPCEIHVRAEVYLTMLQLMLTRLAKQNEKQFVTCKEEHAA